MDLPELFVSLRFVFGEAKKGLEIDFLLPIPSIRKHYFCPIQFNRFTIIYNYVRQTAFE